MFRSCGERRTTAPSQDCPPLQARRASTGDPRPPCVTFRRVVAPLRGPGQSPVLPFACCVGSLRSVGRCGRCSCWCRCRVRGAQWLVCWSPPPPPPPAVQTRKLRLGRAAVSPTQVHTSAGHFWLPPIPPQPPPPPLRRHSHVQAQRPRRTCLLVVRKGACHPLRPIAAGKEGPRFCSQHRASCCTPCLIGWMGKGDEPRVS